MAILALATLSRQQSGDDLIDSAQKMTDAVECGWFSACKVSTFDAEAMQLGRSIASFRINAIQWSKDEYNQNSTTDIRSWDDGESVCGTSFCKRKRYTHHDLKVQGNRNSTEPDLERRCLFGGKNFC
jgi:hypothetical protein